MLSTAAQAAAVAAAAGRPATLLLATTNDRDYVAVFGAPVLTTTSIAMALYAPSAIYKVAQNGINNVTPYHNSGLDNYRSKPLIISDPEKLRFLAAAIRFVPQGGAACPPAHFMIATSGATKNFAAYSVNHDLREAVK